jgi:ubiquinone/menaquinone biosynthesis C-methylase UbiE
MAHDSKPPPKEAGKSSYQLVDTDTLWRELELAGGGTFLDLGCGRGQYALDAGALVGATGHVYAVDLWEEGIESLRKQAAARKLENVTGIVGDILRLECIQDRSVDTCLLSTVLHDLVQARQTDAALAEVLRVLRPDGRLAIIEFKKIPGPPGPPLAIRLSPPEVEEVIRPLGFRQTRIVDLGPQNYLLVAGR